MRPLILLFCLASLLQAVEVPEPFRVILDDLEWVTRDRNKLVWRQGGYDDLHPVRVGNIQASTILWIKTIHTVTGFTQISDRKAIIESDLGTLTLKHWKNRLWLVDFDPKTGPREILRTSGAQWPESMNHVDWDPEAEQGKAKK